MNAPDQACLVRVVPDRLQLDLVPSPLQEHGGATNSELADAAGPQAAADHDPLRSVPFLKPEEPPDHCRELLRKLLDRAQHHASRLGIATHDQLVELLLTSSVGTAPIGSSSILANAIASILEDRPERAPARSVA